MRRNLAALLIGLLLASPIMTGCKSATEPGFDDEYQAWVGTWVGTNARFQINLQIRRGSPYLSCGGLIYSICSEYSDLYVTSSFSDAVTGHSGTGENIFQTSDGLLEGVVFYLLTREVTDTPGIGRVDYAFEGTLQGSQQATGSVLVQRYEPNTVGSPISTESLAMTLRKQ